MKKIVSLLLLCLFLFGAAQTAFAAETDAADTAVTSAAVTDATFASVVIASVTTCPNVVLPNDPAPWQTNAAAILRDTLAQVTGCTSASPAAARICLDDPSVQPPSGKDGAYRIAEKDGDVYISGAGMRGILYGVFGFLENICGCRWYALDTTVIPHADAVTVPQGYAADYTPYFEYCETDWRAWRDPMYATANRMNGSAYRGSVSDAWGGSADYLSGFAHTLTTQFCASAAYFADHPEYFALHNGARTSRQLCLTNPDTVAIVTREVLSLLAARHDPNKSLQIVSLTQNDNGDYCTCDACKAVDDANGSHAGTMITFANTVADAVRAAGYDNTAIDTFAYQYTRKTPTQVVPRDNVIVRLCSIECCFGHPFDDPTCKENVSFMEDLENWSRICKRIYVWDYGTNYSETFNFFPNFRVLQRNMQIFYEHNVLGVYGEGSYYIDSCDGEFGALRDYLQCRLMADPYLDFDAEMDGFLRAYYGDGWQSVRAFIDLCCEKGVVKNKRVSIYDRARGSLPAMTGADVSRCDALWETAIALADTDILREHVLRSQLCWRYWKASNGKREFSIFRLPSARMQARDDLYRDIVASGATCIGEMTRKRGLSDCAALHLLRIPFCWSTLYDHAIWDKISPFVEKVYTALTGREPTHLPTQAER